MKIREILIILLTIILLPEVIAQSWWDNTYSHKKLDINKINIPINNIGGLDRSNTGTVWEHNSQNYYIVYDHGPWVVGKINGIIHLAFEQWYSSYSPGPIINNDAAMNVQPEDSAKYRVYKIGLVDTLNAGKDYLEWPSEYGAETNKNGFPVIYNHQMIWTSYNSLDSSIGDRKVWNKHLDTLPVMPIEIHQVAYAYEWGLQSWLEDVVFFEWIIINKGLNIIDSAYFGLWSDIDFNDLFNIPAVDSSLNLGYCWSPNDSGYFIPMTIGYLLKYGPIIQSQGDTAIFNGTKRANYKNLNLTSFHGIGDDNIIDPIYRAAWSLNDAWNIARGFDADGNVIVDYTTGLPTKFPASGDPVTNTGYIFPILQIGGGAGLVMFSGPVDLAPQDTQWVMAALIVSTGEDYKDAISKLRQKANIILYTPYDLLVKKYSASPPPVIPPERFNLSQNFPNPFNNETKISFELPYATRAVLKIFDILGNEVKVIMDQELEADKYEVTLNGDGLASGVYFYQIFAPGGPAGSFIQTKKMVLLR